MKMGPGAGSAEAIRATIGLFAAPLTNPEIYNFP
jgi:hypothetical protein